MGFDRVHFFAGIGTWDYCLNQSGWGDRPVWTSSLPCQPFSAAGKGLGKSDERHLLPHFQELVRQCKPTVIFGEQVSAAIKHGWLDDLYAEMEACDYAVGSIIIGAHSISAPHIRQRLYWVANSISNSNQREIRRINGKTPTTKISDRQNLVSAGQSCGTSANVRGLVYSDESRSQQRIEATESARHWCAFKSAGCIDGLGNTESFNKQRHRERETNDGSQESFGGSGVSWIYCRDDKYRPIKPGIQPLVDGIAKGMVYSSDTSEPINANATQEARVMRLKGYGNAIQAQTR